VGPKRVGIRSTSAHEVMWPSASVPTKKSSTSGSSSQHYQLGRGPWGPCRVRRPRGCSHSFYARCQFRSDTRPPATPEPGCPAVPTTGSRTENV
jgi:hypothetical protein